MRGEALAGLRVLELSDGVAGAYCGRQFALWGADVAVLEGPAGSPLRHRAPMVGATSLLWEYVAAGKRGAAEPQAATLALNADVVITDNPARLAALTGMAIDALRAAAPDLTIIVITPLGARDALAGSELTIQALSGYLSLNGSPDHAPLRAPGHLMAYAWGVNAFVAGLAAIVGRLSGDAGHLIEISALETTAALLPFLRVEYTGSQPRRDGGPSTGVRVYGCVDGYVSLIPPTLAQRPTYGAVLGIADDEWPHEGLSAVEQRPQLAALLSAHIRDKTVEDVFLGMLKSGIVCGRIASPAMLLGEEHLLARGFFQPLEHPVLGALQVPGAPAKLSKTPAAQPAPAPRPTPTRPAVEWGGAGVLPPGERPGGRPLAGVRIVDVTQAWIGPFAAMLMADMGAEVIKVEAHNRPDVWRQYSMNPVPMAHPHAEAVNASPNYNSVNRNKRSLCLDLKQAAGQAIFRRLVEKADLVMENYTPRVMDRFGLNYEQLAVGNPRLVMASFCGFGKTGPLSDYKANGASIEGIAGWDYLHRHPGHDPLVMGFYQADAITGLQMAAVTLVALVHQRRTGEGQAIDGSMYEAASGYIGEYLLAAQVGAEPEAGIGNRDLDAAPSGVYPGLGEDRWLALSVPDDAAWRRLVAVAPVLRDSPFPTDTVSQRTLHQDDVDALIGAWTWSLPVEQAVALIQSAGVPAAPVRSLVEAMDACELKTWFRPNTHVDMGAHRYNGLAARFAGVAPRADLPPPRLGEHSRAILKHELGLSDAQLEAYLAAGVTGEVLFKTVEAAKA
jgi:crotonobetainyl-CoA:carnitine CoA-transferase CaiB-like acyl-CoA transferase